MSKVKEKKKKVSGLGVLKTYTRYTMEYPWLLTFVFFTAVLSQIVDLTSPLFLRKFFNILADSNPTQQIVHQLFIIILTLAGFYILKWISDRIEVRSLEVLESQVMSNSMNRAFEYLLGHSYDFFISNFAGSLTHKVNRFARAYEAILDGIVFQIFPAFVFVIGATIILYLHNHLLGAILGFWSVGILILQFYLAKGRHLYRTEHAEVETQTTATIADAISNHVTIMLFSGQKNENERMNKAVEKWHEATLRSWTGDSFNWAVLGLCMVAVNITLLYGAFVFWQRGELTVGDFILIQSYMVGTFTLLVGLNRQLRRFYDAFADAGEMLAYMKMPHAIQDVPSASLLKVTAGAIDFKDTTFYFNKDRKVLEHLNLSIAAHERVALVGPSGAGKSTITKLLLRLYDIKGGSIEIDGQDISKVTQDSLRDAISFVPQEPILFHRTLRDNIRYGRRDATDAEVEEAAKKAHCHEFISHLKDGYDTYVGERGIKLSGGERQRVAIARAILKNSPILVLDEATSSLDSESEALIQDALKTLMQGKTVIVIAHRLSTIMNMDRIVVLEGGKIAAQGTHEELVEHKGLYHKLWSIQAGGFIQDDGTGKEEVAEEVQE